MRRSRLLEKQRAKTRFGTVEANCADHENDIDTIITDNRAPIALQRKKSWANISLSKHWVQHTETQYHVTYICVTSMLYCIYVSNIVSMLYSVFVGSSHMLARWELRVIGRGDVEENRQYWQVSQSGTPLFLGKYTLHIINTDKTMSCLDN